MSAKKPAAKVAKKPAAKVAKKSATAKLAKKSATAKLGKKPARGGGPEEMFQARARKRVPFDFVLDDLEAAEPWTRPMFGCTAVYVGDKIVMILRERPAHPHDDGVWLATTAAHHASLRLDFPSMRDITALGDGTTGWQVLPAAGPDFEDEVRRACARVLRGDPRIGKIPLGKRKR